MTRLLVFQHIEREHPSNIALYAADRGMTLDVVKLWEGNLIPNLREYDALVILGGPMGVYEEYAGKQEELSVIKEHMNTLPMLGICLGAQLLAYTLGARVYPFEKEGKRVKEIGYCDVSLTEEGKVHQLFRGFPEEFKILQWHGDTFDLPERASLLASASVCGNQAFAFGDVCGIQFHVEATPEMVVDWIQEDATWTHDGFEMNDEHVRREAYERAPTMKEYCFRLMDNFLA